MRAGSTIRCQSCGSSTASGAEFCRRCGNDLTSPGLIPAISAREDTAERTIVLDSYGPNDVVGRARSTRRPRRRRWIGLAVLLGLAVGSGGGYAAYRGYYADPGATKPAANSAPASTPPSTPPTGPTAGQPPTTVTSTGTPDNPGQRPGDGSSSGPLVGAAPALTGRPETREVVGLLTAYFGAINARDFDAAHRTLVSRPGLPTNETEFKDQYRSTQDRNVRLLNLSPDGGGGYVALVSFISYQDPSDAPDHASSCVVWSMAYPLVRDNDGTLLIDVIGRSGVSYHAC